MWEVRARIFPDDYFAGLVPEEILYEFEGPRIFTSRDKGKELLLVYLCAQDEQAQRYLVAPLSAKELEGLRTGALPVRRALEQRTLWAVEARDGSGVTKAWMIDPAALPADALPEAGVLLWPELRPPLLADQPDRRARNQRLQEKIRKHGSWAA